MEDVPTWHADGDADAACSVFNSAREFMPSPNLFISLDYLPILTWSSLTAVGMRIPAFHMKSVYLLLFAFAALHPTGVLSYEGPHFEWYPILNNASCGRVCKPLGLLPVKAGGKGSSKGKVLCSLYTEYEKGGGAIDEKMTVYRAGQSLEVLQAQHMRLFVALQLCLSAPAAVTLKPPSAG